MRGTAFPARTTAMKPDGGSAPRDCRHARAKAPMAQVAEHRGWRRIGDGSCGRACSGAIGPLELRPCPAALTAFDPQTYLRQSR